MLETPVMPNTKKAYVKRGKKIVDIDIKIINAIQKNPHQPIAKIGPELNLTKTPLHNRYNKLIENGYITKELAIPNLKKFGYTFNIQLKITINTEGDHVSIFQDWISNENAVTYSALLDTGPLKLKNHQTYTLICTCKNKKLFEETVANTLNEFDFLVEYSFNELRTVIKNKSPFLLSELNDCID